MGVSFVLRSEAELNKASVKHSFLLFFNSQKQSTKLIINIMTKVYFIQFDHHNLYMFYALNYDSNYLNKYYREKLSCDAVDYQKNEVKPIYDGYKHIGIIKDKIKDLWEEYNFQQLFEDAEKIIIWDVV